MKSKAQKLREKKYHEAATEEEGRKIWDSWTYKQQMDACVNEDKIMEMFDKAKNGDKEAQKLIDILDSIKL